MSFTCAILHDTSIGSRFRCFQTCMSHGWPLFFVWGLKECFFWHEIAGDVNMLFERKWWITVFSGTTSKVSSWKDILLKSEQPKATRKLCQPTILLLMVNHKGNNTRIHFNYTSSIRTMGVYMLVCYYSVFRLLLTAIKTSSSRKRVSKRVSLWSIWLVRRWGESWKALICFGTCRVFWLADDDIVETISPQMLQSLFASGVGSGCLNKPFHRVFGVLGNVSFKVKQKNRHEQTRMVGKGVKYRECLKSFTIRLWPTFKSSNGLVPLC